MTKKQFRARLRLPIILSLFLLGMIGFAVGKYITTVPLEGSVTFTAKLAESVVLQEHTAQRQADGSYKLVEPYVSQNTYVLLPGLDIPKDPHIVITGKTPIPAYLYVEIVNNTDTVTVGTASVKLIDYAVASGWQESDIAPKNEGTVYVYTGSGDTPLKLTSTPENPIYILDGNQVIVSQYVKSHDVTDNDDTDVLTFYAYLVEAVN